MNKDRGGFCDHVVYFCSVGEGTCGHQREIFMTVFEIKDYNRASSEFMNNILFQ